MYISSMVREASESGFNDLEHRVEQALRQLLKEAESLEVDCVAAALAPHVTAAILAAHRRAREERFSGLQGPSPEAAALARLWSNEVNQD